MTLFLAACGTDSSTDEALSQPGDNFAGTYKFDVDPANESITITPVASAVSNTQLSIKDGFAVTSSAPVWAGGILSTNLTVKNKSPLVRLENVSLRIFNSTDLTITTQATSANIATPGQDNTACNTGADLGAKLVGGCVTAGGPGVTIVGDKGTNAYSAITAAGSGQWTQYVKECTWNGSACNTPRYRGLRVIAPGCTTTGPSVTTAFALGSSATQYTFWTHLYGVAQPANLFNDPRYDVGNASLILRAYEFKGPNGGVGTTLSYDPNLPLTSVASGHWFALAIGADMPGKATRGVAATCDNGNATAGCLANGAPLQGGTAAQRDYDYYLLEDAGNIAARNAKLNWQTAPASNFGWTHLDKVVARIQWDPAVIQTNGVGANEPTCCAGEVPAVRPSTGVNVFQTAAGTNLWSQSPAAATVAHPENQYSSIPIVTSNSNAFSAATVTAQYTYNYGTNPPFLGDGLDGAEYTGTDMPADYVIGIVALKAVGPAGSGASITISNSINTAITIAHGNSASIWSADTNIILQKSNQLGTGTGAPVFPGGWPSNGILITGTSAWGYAESTGENNTGAPRGSYNDGILGLCIQ
jgi:hypothetical protein